MNDPPFQNRVQDDNVHYHIMLACSSLSHSYNTSSILLLADQDQEDSVQQLGDQEDHCGVLRSSGAAQACGEQPPGASPSTYDTTQTHTHS